MILRRYLALSGVELDTTKMGEKHLRAFVKGLHQQSLQHGRPNNAWPLSPKAALDVAKNVAYLSQLVALKQCFGPNAEMGCVIDSGHTVFCKTVEDLIRIGWISAKHAYLDRYLHGFAYMP